MEPDRSRSTRDAFPEFYRLQTRWMDNDVYGHLNNVIHYSLFDTAVNGWLMDNGLLDPQTSETYWLVVESGCRYHAEVRFPTWIEAGLRIARLGNSSVCYQIGLFAEAVELAVADGVFVHVNVSRGSHRPVPLSASVRAALSRLKAADV